METPVPKKPMTMAELLPGLHGDGILTMEAKLTLTGMKKKQPRPTIATSHTTEKTYRPISLDEMRASIRALNHTSPKRNVQQANSMKKKWNSSVKVQKRVVSITENNQMKFNPVRKVLNFPQPKPKIPVVAATSNTKIPINPVTPKFLKPEIKPRKTLHMQTRNMVRISGICNIPETPVHLPANNNRKTMIANKENVAHVPVIHRMVTTPKSSLRKRILASRIPDTPLSNESWKSSCDDSFLQNEKDIELEDKKTENNIAMEIESSEADSKDVSMPLQHQKVDSKIGTIGNRTLESITEVSPPVSTPFKQYRSVSECFLNSSNVTADMSSRDSTDLLDNVNENSKREESVIVSLCDMLNKASVSTNTNKTSTDLDDLLEVRKQALNKLKMIENGIKTLNSLKESEIKTLQYVSKLIEEKQGERASSESEKDKTLIETTKHNPTPEEVTPEKSPVISKPCSVIKSCLKSPSYKIPKKSSCMRKKVHYRSMPNVSTQVTPEKDMGPRAMSMYMKMKEHMNFLSTPAKTHCPVNVMDTPAKASHNLQKQLDKLYNQS